jgi:hypothetical protein
MDNGGALGVNLLGPSQKRERRQRLMIGRILGQIDLKNIRQDILPRRCPPGARRIVP